ncbi:MAG TPA: (2Fe-2S)-binding protein, partial [Alteraurantiacibacter sp.]
RHEVSDMMRGMRRISVTAPDGALLAALYATRAGRLPERDWIARQFAAQDASPVELLAGRPSAPQPDRGPLVCLCHDVGENELLAAAEAGAETVAAIGAATCAGTNCGSCRPIIARLLQETRRGMREAAE